MIYIEHIRQYYEVVNTDLNLFVQFLTVIIILLFDVFAFLAEDNVGEIVSNFCLCACVCTR